MGSGYIIIDKEADWTSHDVVAKLRGIFHTRTIGHTGTLDPMATGVLVVMVGKATKAGQFLEQDDKVYAAVLKTGIITNTQDTTGEILERRDPETDLNRVKAAAQSFIGKTEQIPPMYSAIKINGKKLYELARRGVEVERRPRPVEFYSIDVSDLGDGEYELTVHCSKGAYIRTLCHDIGAALGCGGAMSSLRRLRAGSFSLADSITIGELAKIEDPHQMLKPVDSAFDAWPKLTVTQSQEKKCRCGAQFKVGQPDGCYRVYTQKGKFFMLCTVENGIFKNLRGFFDEEEKPQ